jgi:uncharacterized membrane protein
VVFSITIVALTLAATQFEPRMLRNFTRDRVTQLTLGTFVASFSYAVIMLVSIAPGRHGEFVPHLSVTVALVFVVVDLGVLIVFIDHISKLIQLPQVIASIAGDLAKAIDAEIPAHSVRGLRTGPSVSEMTRRMDEGGGVIRARRSVLPAVHPHRDADGSRVSQQLRRPSAPTARAFRRSGPAARDSVAT